MRQAAASHVQFLSATWTFTRVRDTFSLHVSVADAGPDANGQFRESFRKNASALKKVKALVSHG